MAGSVHLPGSEGHSASAWVWAKKACSTEIYATNSCSVPFACRIPVSASIGRWVVIRLARTARESSSLPCRRIAAGAKCIWPVSQPIRIKQRASSRILRQGRPSSIREQSGARRLTTQGGHGSAHGIRHANGNAARVCRNKFPLRTGFLGPNHAESRMAFASREMNAPRHLDKARNPGARGFQPVPAILFSIDSLPAPMEANSSRQAYAHSSGACGVRAPDARGLFQNCTGRGACRRASKPAQRCSSGQIKLCRPTRQGVTDSPSSIAFGSTRFVRFSVLPRFAT